MPSSVEHVALVCPAGRSRLSDLLPALAGVALVHVQVPEGGVLELDAALGTGRSDAARASVASFHLEGPSPPCSWARTACPQAARVLGSTEGLLREFPGLERLKVCNVQLDAGFDWGGMEATGLRSVELIGYEGDPGGHRLTLPPSCTRATVLGLKSRYREDPEAVVQWLRQATSRLSAAARRQFCWTPGFYDPEQERLLERALVQKPRHLLQGAAQEDLEAPLRVAADPPGQPQGSHA